jgi:hypothetical protein
MKNSIKIIDFDFKFKGYGHYKVDYKSPITGKIWSCVTTDMELIDCTKNTDDPKKVDLIKLKRICKR